MGPVCGRCRYLQKTSVASRPRIASIAQGGDARSPDHPRRRHWTGGRRAGPARAPRRGRRRGRRGFGSSTPSARGTTSRPGTSSTTPSSPSVMFAAQRDELERLLQTQSALEESPVGRPFAVNYVLAPLIEIVGWPCSGASVSFPVAVVDRTADGTVRARPRATRVSDIDSTMRRAPRVGSRGALCLVRRRAAETVLDVVDTVDTDLHQVADGAVS